MKSTLSQIFQISMSDSLEIQQTRIMRVITYVLLAIFLISMLAAPFDSRTPIYRLINFLLNGIVVGTCVFALWLLHQKQLRIATSLLTVILALLLSVDIVISGITNGDKLLQFLIPVLIAGFIMSRRFALFLVCVEIVGLSISYSIYLDSPIYNVPEARGLILSFISIVFTFYIVFERFSTAYRRAFQTLNDQKIELSTAYDRLKYEYEERLRLLGILEATSDYIAMVDGNRELIYRNHALREFDEKLITPEYLFPNWALDMLKDGIKSNHAPHDPEQQIWHDERNWNISDENELPVSQVFITHFDHNGKPVYLSTIGRDIRERKQAETEKLELALHKERLKTLREFIDEISHDFKTPLSVIKTSLYLIERSDDQATQKTRLEQIAQQTEILRKMIQNILDTSRMENKYEVNFESVDLHQLLHDVHNSFTGEIMQANLHVNFSLHPDCLMIQADYDEIQRVFTNIFSNAIKYSLSDSKIHVKTDLKQDGVVIEVNDNGIGIAEADLSRIFERFYRTQQVESGNIEGSGIGLSVVKKIVDRHNGKIEVESAAGKGSTFRIWLPIMQTQNA